MNYLLEATIFDNIGDDFAIVSIEDHKLVEEFRLRIILYISEITKNRL